uniref:Uncharacterized protein n=1 Tax=Nelumbo nucifera TaxID=4432 RepID=A0A823A4L5_NELNU|nr:TPA_asm: hypothetical protein HUJ06_018775 [Nelumbo nucifera]
MAFLCHLSSFFPCTSHELCTFHRSSFVIGQEQRQRQLRWGTHCNPPRRVLITISASSSKKPRVGKKVKSNVDLCNELREFVSAAGLPEGHVPSLKELSHHGREDLAKIVRRRGYKLITDLLSNSTKEETNLEASSAENENGTDSYKNESKGQDENVIGFSEEVSLPNDNSIIENEFSSANGIQILNSGVGSCMSAGSSTSLSLQEKAAKFIQNGELDIIEGRRFNNLENNIEAESREPSEESSKYITTRTRVTSLLNGSALASRHVVLPATENHYHRNDFSQAQGVQVAAFNEDMDAEDFEVITITINR